MKRIVLTTLALTLLGGTSALAQANSIRQMRDREAAAERAAPAQAPQAAPARREEAPRAQPRPERTEAAPQARPQGGGGPQRDRGDRPDRPQFQPQAQPQAQAPQVPRGPEPVRQGGRGDQFGPRPQQAGPQQQRPQQRPPQQIQPGFVGGVAQRVAEESRARAEANRPGGRDNGGRDNGGRGPDRNDNRPGDRDGWNGQGQRPGQWAGQRPGQDGRPVIRPQDRRDRDYNRPRYDQRRYPQYVTPRARYHWYGPSYRPPVGFYYSSWRFGQTLPWNWYTPNYYLNDWWDYGLPMPPAGMEWVRVGYDVVLIDVFTGRIHQVIRNLFW